MDNFLIKNDEDKINQKEIDQLKKSSKMEQRRENLALNSDFPLERQISFG